MTDRNEEKEGPKKIAEEEREKANSSVEESENLDAPNSSVEEGIGTQPKTVDEEITNCESEGGEEEGQDENSQLVAAVEPLTITPESDVEATSQDETPSEPFKFSRPTQFPLLNVSGAGTLSVILRHDLVVEMNVDRSLRVSCPGKFAAAVSSHGSVSCIMHPQAKILQEEKDIFTQFGSDKLAMLGTQGIMFTMRGLGQTFLVCDLLKGFTPIPSACVRFPTLSTDYTQKLFHSEDYHTFSTPHRKSIAIQVCQDFCRSATYDMTADGTINVRVNGVHIRQELNGDLEVTHRPRSIKASPINQTVQVRTNFIEIGVEGNESYVKRGAKQIHVSESGMVVSDGSNTTSMDQCGRILSPS